LDGSIPEECVIFFAGWECGGFGQVELYGVIDFGVPV